ncbi:4-(cytidine 5'-diphospho)-2-C-methyl-D-erythritol kinase [Sphingomonas sp.]|jgi:4-diphosphocytidyl-2-C-methyl-D-erythritol kinase|uniref:4-(cytidine 5'-diphospho)-2-C-methyl-D-erythritol kinase n=1 Tax=Sphingomonas sp. TaxID=28214 RepID=UPI002D7FC72A|nr:4-(cytidine 5'-diphospho)-2-C-methyl-D-erythritol kinase [Sphingomonas sp.]HEU0044792.1 4-(cytidine 5'-diphospho)-2-C-methyl-D-erythritol kinase [Sphingomonas sp.]
MIVEPAPAKINLALHIRRKRTDGYHDLETLFAFARDGDVVTVNAAERDVFTVTGPFAAALSVISSPAEAGAQQPPSRFERAEPAHPSARNPATAFAGEDDNLVTRAASAFRAAFAIDQRYAIELDKRLPVASGIGGGSADAAATLRALAKLNAVDPQHPHLFTIAAALGADVPACLLGRPALGTGRGDRLDSLPLFGDLPLLLVNPRVGLATAPMFAGWDGIDRGPISTGGTVLERAGQAGNDFTASATRAAPPVGKVLAMLSEAQGSSLVRMSGSGATCFALFEDEASRDQAATAAGQRGWWTMATVLV